MTQDAGSYLIVWTRDESQCCVSLADEPVIDAAVTRWVDSARTRDEVLHLTTVVGATYRVLASEITSWMDSTPEMRHRSREREDALKAEAGPAWDSDA